MTSSSMTNTKFTVDLWAALPFPSLYLNANNQILRLNAAGENLLGKSERQLTQQTLEQVFAKSSIVLDAVAQTRQSHNARVVYGVDIPTPDRNTWQCNLFVNFANENNDHLLLCFQTTGAAEKIERTLTHRTAARSVAGLSAMLAHEIRNPLTGISGAAQLLLTNSTKHEEREWADMIAQEAKRINRLVNRFEHFSDQRPLRHQAFNIHDVLDRALRSAQAGFGQGITFQKRYDPSLPLSSGEPDQILQVFQNLLKNAAEAAPAPNGKIKITTTYHSGVKFATKSVYRITLPLQIKIADNGCGIPENLIDDVFNPFVSTKSNGTGLGLPLVSKILTDHGGLIELNSTPYGTEIIVRLPIWAA